MVGFLTKHDGDPAPLTTSNALDILPDLELSCVSLIMILRAGLEVYNGIVGGPAGEAAVRPYMSASVAICSRISPSGAIGRNWFSGCSVSCKPCV